MEKGGEERDGSEGGEKSCECRSVCTHIRTYVRTQTQYL